MSPLIAIAITTGILSAVWGWVAVTLGLISWVGFLGCTSYFASSGGYKALLQTLLCNASGMLWALLLIHGDAWWGAGVAGYLMTGVVATPDVRAGQAAVARLHSRHLRRLLRHLRCGGEWRLILPSLIIGALFGYLMKASGLWLSRKTQKTQAIAGVTDPA